MQVHDRYLVPRADEGVVVIDQHALHERILYEQIAGNGVGRGAGDAAAAGARAGRSQPGRSAAALADQEFLARLGVQVEPFGGGTLLVSSYPAMLGQLQPAEVLRLLVDRLLAGGKRPTAATLLDELLHMISCKAAIKAGDRLSPKKSPPRGPARIWPRTATTARTAGRRRWFSRAKSWTGNSSGPRQSLGSRAIACRPPRHFSSSSPTRSASSRTAAGGLAVSRALTTEAKAVRSALELAAASCSTAQAVQDDPPAALRLAGLFPLRETAAD